MNDPVCFLCGHPFTGPVCDCAFRSVKPLDAEAKAVIEQALKTGDFVFVPGWNADAPEITQEEVIEMFRKEVLDDD